MVTRIKNLPDSVLGFVYDNHITDEDYKKVLFPAIEDAIKNKDKIRVLIEIGNNFKSLNMHAILDDTLIGLKYFFKWERIAIISNHDRINHMLAGFSFLIPAQIKIFSSWKREDAIKWITTKG